MDLSLFAGIYHQALQELQLRKSQASTIHNEMA